MNNALQVALQITSVQAAVLTKNMQLRDKINVLRTVTDQCVPEPDCKFYKKRLDAIAEYSKHRNMIAHDSFHPDDKGDGVHFVVVKAQNKLLFPDTRWSIADFQARVAEIDAFDGDVKKLTRYLPEFSRWRIDALISSAMTMRDREAQERANHLLLLAGELPNSDGPNREIDLQTPPSSDRE